MSEEPLTPQQKGTSAGPQVSVGDVVTMHADGQPRGMWRLGHMEKLLLATMGRPEELCSECPGEPDAYAHPYSGSIPSRCPLKMVNRNVPLTGRKATIPDRMNPNLPSHTTEAFAASKARDRLLALILGDIDHVDGQLGKMLGTELHLLQLVIISLYHLIIALATPTLSHMILCSHGYDLTQ